MTEFARIITLFPITTFVPIVTFGNTTTPLPNLADLEILDLGCIMLTNWSFRKFNLDIILL